MRRAPRGRTSPSCTLAARLGAPIVVTLGGGYGREIEATAAAHANVYLGLVERLG